MTGGPKPKPTPVKKPSAPKPPDQVKNAPRALTEWKRIVPELMNRKILTNGDRATLAQYCIFYARWQDAEDRVAAEGTLVKTKSGNVIHHPALGMANTAAKLCQKFAVELGLTPSSRGRIRAEPEEDPDDIGLEMPGD